MSEEPILVAKGISKEFNYPKKVVILSNINLTVQPHETISIVGPSGSGKSTLLHILGTLENPTSGEVVFNGSPVLKGQVSHLRSQKIGFVFQSGNLLEEYTLLDNLLIKARIARRNCAKNTEAYLEAMALLDRVGLSPRSMFSVKYLSGGEKQRAAIARAFMNNPEIILADEPTGNLDSISAANAQSLLVDFCQERGKSLVVVTHDTHFANLCDHKYQLQDGALIEEHVSPY